MLADPAAPFDREVWRPPPDLALSAWADEHFVLSPESSAEPGRWRTLPYQREIMNAITDPDIERVTVMKSARVGFTKILDAAIGYHIHQDPAPIMVVQPTIDDAKGYSQDEITPMLRDVAVLRELVGDPTVKTSGQTIKRKEYPGGVLQLVGANSPTGFRRVSRRVIILDEVDAYPPSAGSDGDPVELAIKRSEYFHNRKIVAGSTPLLEGASRIKQLFEEGDQRRYHVPCPHCGDRDFLTFREEAERGHWMAWDEGEPETAHFVCRGNGCIIEEHHKLEMLAAGEWIAEGELTDHASFHIWAAYSVSPNSTWPKIAARFLKAKEKSEQLRVFVNTDLGETWRERGEAPKWQFLYLRREPYAIGTVPEGVVVVTGAVDVQKDRFVCEVVGWGLDKQSWVIDAFELWGDTADEETWKQLDELLAQTFSSSDGRRRWMIKRLAIDSGYRTQMVYNWAKKYRAGWRVIATKGVHTARTLIGQPSPVELNVNGKKIARGYKVWPVSPDKAKEELYGWLGLEPEVGEGAPAGYVHFPELGEEFFRQLTGEQLVGVVNKKTGFTDYIWQLIPGRQNHWLDTHVLNRAAVFSLGLDNAGGKRKRSPRPPSSPPSSPPSASESDTPQGKPKTQAKARKKRSPAKPFVKGRDWFRGRR